MPRRRSPAARKRRRERRLARRVVQNAAYFDRELAESINVLTSEQIAILTMKREFKLGWSVHVGKEYEKGEVIRDVRGRGSLQKVPIADADFRLFKRMERLNEERRLVRLERSQSVKEPNGEEEPVLVEVFQPMPRQCRVCKQKVCRASKLRLCRGCYQRERAKQRRGEPSLLD